MLGTGIVEALIKNVGSDLPKLEKNDYMNEADGLIYCKVCNKPKQKKIHIPVDGIGDRIVRIQCRCEQEAYAKKERMEKLKKEQEAVNRLRGLSLMDEKVKDSTFDCFQMTEQNARILKVCRRYAEAFDTMVEKNQGMLFWGAPGTGKTFAAACIANYLLERLQPVIMTSFVKLVALLQKKGDGEDEETVIWRLNRAKLLIIDDLGAERSTDYALERVYNVIDSRYRSKRPMLLTTNMTLDEMQSTSDIRYTRIYDRVFEVCYPMEFRGRSWRIAEAERRFDEMQELLEG